MDNKKEGKDIAHFKQVREKNTRSIRNIMRQHESVGKTELAELSGLSYPTVSAVLKDLMQTGESVTVGDAVSSGGRPALAYALNAEFQMGACAIIDDMKLTINMIDVFGREKEIFQMPLKENTTPAEFVAMFAQVKAIYPQMSVAAIGVPGVVLEGNVRRLPILPRLENKNLKKLLETELGITVFMENDINTIVLAERDRWDNLAHLFITHGNCIGVGIMIQKNLVRGVHGFAGEVEKLCDMHDRMTYMVQIIRAITCIIDVGDIAFSDTKVSEAELKELHEKLCEVLPEEEVPELHIVENSAQLYQKGLKEMVIEEWKIR